MTAAPMAAPQPVLVPATIPDGRAKGSTNSRVLQNVVSGVYHCAVCDYISHSYHGCMSHLSTHSDKPRKRRTAKPAEPTIEDKLAVAADILTEIRADLDANKAAADETPKVDAEWKSRALAAEKSLKSLRRILGTEE